MRTEAKYQEINLIDLCNKIALPKTPFTSLDKLPLLATSIYELSSKYRLDMNKCDTNLIVWRVTIHSSSDYYLIKIFDSKTHPYELEGIGNLSYLYGGDFCQIIGFPNIFKKKMSLVYQRPNIKINFADLPVMQKFDMHAGNVVIKVPATNFIGIVDPYLMDLLAFAIDENCLKSDPISMCIHPVGDDNVGIAIDGYLDAVYIPNGNSAKKQIDEATFRYTPENIRIKQLSDRHTFEVLIQKLLE